MWTPCFAAYCPAHCSYMGAANVEPAPLMVDAEPDDDEPLDEPLPHAAAVSRTPIVTAPTAMPRGARLRCRILIRTPSARSWPWSMASDLSVTGFLIRELTCSLGDERHPVRVAHPHEEWGDLAGREVESAHEADHPGIVGRIRHGHAGHPDGGADRVHARSVVRDQQASVGRGRPDRVIHLGPDGKDLDRLGRGAGVVDEQEFTVTL